MFIDDQTIEEIKQRIDIAEEIALHVSLKSHGKTMKGLCPFHSEKTPSFVVNRDKQSYHCFGCGAHGTAVGFLMEYDHMEFVEAVETLARAAGVEVPREGGGGRERRDHSQLYELLERAEKLYRSLLKRSPEAVAYLKDRGLTGVVARDFGIGFAPDAWHTVSEAFGEDAAEADLRGLCILCARGECLIECFGIRN